MQPQRSGRTHENLVRAVGVSEFLDARECVCVRKIAKQTAGAGKRESERVRA